MPDNDKSFLQPIASEDEDAEVSLRQYQINSYPADFTLEVLVSKWKKGEIRKEGFQRKYVWPQLRASKLIESFLLGLPVPPVYLYEERGTANKLIVDGHQRLRSIVYFFSGWFGDPEEMSPEEIVPFNLVGLHEKSPYSNASYQDLEEKDPEALNRLKDSVLRSFIMKQTDPDDDSSIFEIFSRFNTGGMPLMPQEIRNCVLTGPFNELLKALNQNDAWRKIVGVKKEDKRMRDMELILRFFALFENSATYIKPMKEFLNKFMGANRRPPEDAQENDTPAKKEIIENKQQAFALRMQAFEQVFTQTADEVVRCLGAKPFNIKRGLNAAVFDSVFTAFAQHLDSAKIADAESLRAKYIGLLGDEDYQQLITAATTDQDNVRSRITTAGTALFG